MAMLVFARASVPERPIFGFPADNTEKRNRPCKREWKRKELEILKDTQAQGERDDNLAAAHRTTRANHMKHKNVGASQSDLAG